MELRIYQIGGLVSFALLLSGFLLGEAEEFYSARIALAVAGITIPFAMALIWIALLLIRQRNEPDEFQDLINSHRRKSSNPGPDAK
jgi:hypothetical protein